MENTLIIHAIGVPVIFATLSWIYFRFSTHLAAADRDDLRFFRYPDRFLRHRHIRRKSSPCSAASWAPGSFGLIFTATYLTGWLTLSRSSGFNGLQALSKY
jgi:hypothetical protein